MAYNDGLWNLLGMVLVGFGSVLLGGCPCGSSSSPAAATVTPPWPFWAWSWAPPSAHNFGLASSAKGPTANGQIAVILGLIVVAAIGAANLNRKKA